MGQREEIREYFKSPRLNASRLKGLDNPKMIKFRADNPDTEDEDKRHFRIGSAIDCLLTTPALFNEEFIVMYQNRPTGFMGVFIDSLPLDLTEESELDRYQEAYEKAGYKMSIDSVVKHLWEIEKNKEYYLMRKLSEEKRIISLDELDEVTTCKRNVLENPYAVKYFINTDPNQKVFKQLTIYFEHGGTECKAMLDSVLIDLKEKTVQPIDLKSTGTSVIYFKRNVINFKYYLQAGFYHLALKWKMENENWYKDFKLLPMKFVASEKKGKVTNSAIIFNMSMKDIEKSIHGGVMRLGSSFVKTKGINQLMKDLQWHHENDYWEMSKDLIDKKGEENLSLFSEVDFDSI